MDTIQKIINYTQDYINSVPAHSWYALGVLLGSIAVPIGLTAWVKRHHLKQTGEKLASEFIVLNVAFWGMVATTTDFVITNGHNFGPFLPFLSAHWPQVSGGAIAVHAVATGLSKWWKDRKTGKPITASTEAPSTSEPATAPVKAEPPLLQL